MKDIYVDYSKVKNKVGELIANSTEDATFFTMSPDDFDLIVKEFEARGFTAQTEILAE